jgi:hypothetical protein
MKTINGLIRAIEQQRALMVAVSTGGPRIDDVNTEYTKRRSRISRALAEQGIENPNPYDDLWQWYGKWSSGDLPTYQSRREYISGLFASLIDRLNAPPSAGTPLPVEPTGWVRVDRTLGKVRQQLEAAKDQEDFQQVGLLCRELLISLAQAVHDSERHPPVDNVDPS